MVRILTVAACAATVLGLAACGDDTLFNKHPPPSGSGTPPRYAPAPASTTPSTGPSTGNPSSAQTATKQAP